MNIETKIAEFRFNFLNLKYDIDIPTVTFQIHPAILNLIQKCEEKGLKATVDDLADQIKDSTFLNELHANVNQWVKEIRKVTELENDINSSTTLQEISFWLNFDHVLCDTQKKIDIPEVKLTLDVLKKCKRFHAIASFDMNIRLEQTIETVNNFKLLMKYFPLNDLLSATKLDSIKIALNNIFLHLKKLKNSKYPIERVFKLLEAISRDLMIQLLKVIDTRGLMHISFKQFEKVFIDGQLSFN
jgi:dynein heavy chain 1